MCFKEVRNIELCTKEYFTLDMLLFIYFTDQFYMVIVLFGMSSIVMNINVFSKLQSYLV